MGKEKAFIRLGNETILSRIISRLTPQVTMIAINANGDPARYANTHLPVIADRRSDAVTPLAGLHAALVFAREHAFDAVATTPSDTPFLPSDLVRRLQSMNAPAAIATSGGQSHFLTGLWSPALLEKLEHELASGLLRLKDWASASGAATVDWPTRPFDPFFNVNSPEDLAEAQRIAAEFEP